MGDIGKTEEGGGSCEGPAGSSLSSEDRAFKASHQKIIEGDKWFGQQKAPCAPGHSEKAANNTGSTAYPAFNLRFEGQDRSKILQDTGTEIDALVPAIQGLRSQKDKLSPEGRATLQAAEQRLQEQMNYYALASDNAGALRASGRVPADGSFELNLRIAESFRKGADDFAAGKYTPDPAVLPGQGESQSMSGAEIAHRLRGLVPEKADALIDNAISIAGMPHLDTTGLMTDRARSNSAGALGWDFAGRLTEPVDAVDRNWSFRDNFSFSDATARKRMDSSNVRYLTAGVEAIATSKLSKSDLDAVHYRGQARLGAKFYAQDLPGIMYAGAGAGIARAAKEIGARQMQAILKNEGPEALAEVLSGAGKRRTGKAGGNWPIQEAVKDKSVVRQKEDFGCGAACSEMVLGDRGLRVPQKNFGGDLRGTGMVVNDLNKHQPGWMPGLANGTEADVRKLSSQGSWIANMRDFKSGSRFGHFVVVDGVNPAGGVMVRDPWNGYRYTMKMQDFLEYWTLEAAHKP
jgi:hypothetical protein